MSTGPEGTKFQLKLNNENYIFETNLIGKHNILNLSAIIIYALSEGFSKKQIDSAILNLQMVKRRQEVRGIYKGALVIDDFAHHPTAITTTLDGAKKKLAGRRIWAIIEPRSNTMKMGIHQDSLAQSAALADYTLWYEPTGLEWGLREVIETATTATPNIGNQQVLSSVEDIIAHISSNATAGDAIVIMSNGGFEGIHQRLLAALSNK